MRNICQRIFSDITFMATHNLMDYSLLLITERNLDYKEESDASIKFGSSMSRKDTGRFNKPALL